MALVDIKVPSIGESVTEVTLARWMVQEGQYVVLDQILCEFESDKATFELPAEVAGKISLLAAEKDDLSVGAIVAQIDTDAVGDVAEAAANPVQPIQSPATPLATITPPKVSIQSAPTPELNLQAPKAASEERLNLDETRGDRREKMSRMRRTIARRLVSAKNETAMLTTFNEMDMTAINELRKTYNDQFVAKYGVKLGFMSLFCKACSKILLEMPEVNAFVDGDDIVYHPYTDIAVAISTPNGLVVPPVRNVQDLKLHEIELQIKDLAEKARNGTLSMQDMTGGTFTITNGGVFGSLMSTPILNEPQSAILGMHAIKDRPVAIDGKIEIRPMMYLALSYDHRIIDGKDSVGFLVKVKELIENPERMFTGGYDAGKLLLGL